MPCHRYFGSSWCRVFSGRLRVVGFGHRGRISNGLILPSAELLALQGFDRIAIASGLSDIGLVEFAIWLV